jgi:hypothetical protein
MPLSEWEKEQALLQYEKLGRTKDCGGNAMIKPPRIPKPKFRWAKLKFEPRDIWIGLYWNFKNDGHKFGKWWRYLDIYICIVPTIPLQLHFET